MKTNEFENRIIELSDYIQHSARMFTRDVDSAYDLAQETILRALENQEKYRMNTNLKGWLKVMMKNIFINGVNKKANKNTTYNSDHFKVIVGESDMYSPEDQYNLSQIYLLIEQLIEEYKIPFKLHTSGYKYQEIAEELNIPIGTVKSRIFQARKLLSEKIRA